ncbi:MAG TPA: pyruvate dehydrogenase complex dihydrolipoamide acetyltransferase, partial [Rhodobacteraceae bacterium]|nr:pyruvate dehydrogenase complex dihydrolipoamide acetyltransferase [Paracoccaceae bacterium]
MPATILMPALSPTMETGKLTAWHVGKGDRIAAGDVIAEIETDKATMEVEAVEDGVIGTILVDAGGEDVAVNTPIALVLLDGEDESALEDYKPGLNAVESESEPVESRSEETESESEQTPASDSAAREITAGGSAPPSVPAAAPAPGPRLFASPLARRIAAQQGIDLATLTGSGPGGRIVKADVEAAAARPPVSASAPAASAPAAPLSPSAVTALYEPGGFEEMPLDSMRATIARRLTDAKRDIPHYYLTIDCRIDALLAARKTLNERLAPLKVSVNDFIIRAMALALMRVPEANAAWAGDRLLKFRHADIAMAVAIEGGLVTPIIRRAEEKGLAAIAAEARDLAQRARERKLLPPDYEGGSFTVSNLGMFGIRNFTA